jgi:5'-nucleotidase
VSLVGAYGKGYGQSHYQAAGAAVARLIEKWPRLQLPNRTILNVNVPDLPAAQLRGYQTTRLGHRGRSKDVLKQADPRGRPAYWIGISGDPLDAGEGTDFHAVHAGYVSVTPLQTDMTRQDVMQDVVRWLRHI